MLKSKTTHLIHNSLSLAPFSNFVNTLSHPHALFTPLTRSRDGVEIRSPRAFHTVVLDVKTGPGFAQGLYLGQSEHIDLAFLVGVTPAQQEYSVRLHHVELANLQALVENHAVGAPIWNVKSDLYDSESASIITVKLSICTSFPQYGKI